MNKKVPPEVERAYAAVERVKTAYKNAPRSDFVAHLHASIQENWEDLEIFTGRQFCKAADLKESYGSEFSKALKVGKVLAAKKSRE